MIYTLQNFLHMHYFTDVCNYYVLNKIIPVL